MNFKRLEQILAENMLRFGVKNLSEATKDQIKMIIEQTNIDWTKGGKYKKFEEADLADMIAFIRQQDGSKFNSIPVYAPMIQWFEKNGRKKKNQAGIKKSLANWANADNQAGDMKKVAAAVAPLMPGGLSNPAAQKALAAGAAVPKNMDYSKYITPVKTALERATTANHTILQGELTTYLNWLNAQQGKIMINSAFAQWMDKINAQLAKYTGATMISIKPNYTKVQKEYTALLKKNALGAATEGMNDGQRTALLTKLMQEVVKKQQAKPKFFDGIAGGSPDIETVVAAADSIVIGKGTTAVTATTSAGETIKAATQPKTFVDWSFQYPPKEVADTEQGAEQARQMFGDDKAKLSAEVANSIKAELAKLDTEYQKIQDQMETAGGSLGKFEFRVVSVQFRSVSSTSAVRSAYNGLVTKNDLDRGTAQIDPKTNQYSTGKIKGKTVQIGYEKPRATKADGVTLDFDVKRNEPLAADRVAEMIKLLKAEWKSTKLAKKGFTQKIKPLETESGFKYPNNGPTWGEKVGGYDQFNNKPITINDYGPLFQAAYKRNPRITAQMFYGGRNAAAVPNASKLLGKPVTADQLVQEYEETYKKYRTSACGIAVLVEMIPIPGTGDQPTSEFAVSSAGSFTISIYWDSLTWRDIKNAIPDINFRLFKPNMGGGSSMLGKIKPWMTLGCPKW